MCVQLYSCFCDAMYLTHGLALQTELETICKQLSMFKTGDTRGGGGY